MTAIKYRQFHNDHLTFCKSSISNIFNLCVLQVEEEMVTPCNNNRPDYWSSQRTKFACQMRSMLNTVSTALFHLPPIVLVNNSNYPTSKLFQGPVFVLAWVTHKYNPSCLICRLSSRPGWNGEGSLG